MSIVNRGPDDARHNNWRGALAELLSRERKDIIGYVVITATRDQQIVVDTNSGGPEGTLMLLTEAIKIITQGATNVEDGS
jgi:hypothetical protein